MRFPLTVASSLFASSTFDLMQSMETNMQVLQFGVQMQQSMGQSGDWLPMTTAPHDGTTIEIRCTYGVAPWFGLFKWTTEFTTTQDGKIFTFQGAGQWRGAEPGKENLGIGDEGSDFTWRPYHGNASAYHDPTGGIQNDPAYWRGAVAARYGLPLDAFEKPQKP